MANGDRRFRQSGRDELDQPNDFALDDPLSCAAGEPLDMAQVRADDALIDGLTQAERPTGADPLDERLATLLAAWKADVEADPAGELVDVDSAVAAVRSAPRPHRRRPLFGPLTAAAAIAVMAFGGVGLVAKDSEPGDPLWGISKVLYAERARSVEAAIVIRSHLDVADSALRSGQVEQAEQALAEAQQKLPVVQDKDGKDRLAARTELLRAQLAKLTPIPSAPTTTSTESPSSETPSSSSSTSETPSSSTPSGTTGVESPETTSRTGPTGSGSEPTTTSRPGESTHQPGVTSPEEEQGTEQPERTPSTVDHGQ